MDQFHINGAWSPETTATINGSTWAKEFFDFCSQAVADEKVFKNFKQHPAFTLIVGSDARDLRFAQQCVEQITNPQIQELLPKFGSGDQVGNPLMYELDGVGAIAPGTLYHASILNDLINRIGDVKDLDVVEIGPGYGGQAKILLDYGIKSCTLIDVLPALNLQKKYLSLFGYDDVSFWDSNNVKDGKWDVVVSNWCLSEFNVSGIKFYVEKIISKCNSGYFWMNMWESDKINFVLDLMRKYFSSVEVFEESNKTHANRNWLLVIKK